MEKFRLNAIVKNVIDLAPGNPGHFRLRLHTPRIVDIIKPGQFLHILPPGNTDILRRPISIMGVDKKASDVEILLRVIGEGTKLIAGSSPGDELDIIGPLGNGYPVIDGRKAVLVGGGVGIPPLVYLARILHEKNIDVTVLLGARDNSTLICVDEFKEAGIEPLIATEDGSVGHLGFVTDLIKNESISGNPVVYACGPIPMLRAVEKKCTEMGFSDCYVSLENKLGCGIGACLGCSVPVWNGNDGVKYLRVCTDGPVFKASDVIFEKMI